MISPTLMQEFGAPQDTPQLASFAPAGLRIGLIVQPTPFQLHATTCVRVPLWFAQE
jgi:hypothetical protein